MVALYQDPQDPKMEQNDTDKTLATSSSKGGSSDDGDAPMQSDGGGRSSTISSPPSAGDMSYVVEEEEARKAAQSTNANMETQRFPAEMIDRVEQLADLATSFASTNQESDLSTSLIPDQPPSSIQSLTLPSRAGRTPDHTISSYRSLEGSLRKNVPIAPAGTPALVPLPTPDSKVASSPATLADGTSKTAATTASPRISGAVKNSPRLSSASNKSKQAALRRGKWTVEEEAYVARVIQDFNSGFLNAPAGTTLRTYLSEKLKCDPMRITKKFTGDACIGKRVFHPAVRTPSNSAGIDKAHTELDSLERRWRRRLEMQQRESTKKAAASAAVTAVSSGRSLTSSNSNDMASDDVGRNPVAKTASWLDRAKLALQDQQGQTTEEQRQQAYYQHLATTEEAILLQDQMHEVQRLIHEGPNIQQTSADLPQILDEEHDPSPSSSQEYGSSDGAAASAAAHHVEPADKRMKTAQDAEALVGFLRSVRSAAASGEEF